MNFFVFLFPLVTAPHWKTCDDSPFCNRFREFFSSSNPPVVSAGEIRPIATGVYRAPLEKPALDLEISFYEFGIVRVTIDETSPIRKRYRIPEGDVVMEDLARSDKVEISRNGRETVLTNDWIQVTLTHSPFQIEIFRYGELVQVLDGALHFETGCVTCTVARKEEDSMPYGPSGVGWGLKFPGAQAGFGLPGHTLPFKLPLDTEIRMFNLDRFPHEVGEANGLYGSIPFLFTLRDDGTASGVLWLNPSDTFVKLSKESSLRSWWVSESGIIDLFVFPGPSHSDVLKTLHYVTGRAPLPPLWALGAHHSKWGFHSQEEISSISKGFTEHDLPLDVLWLDIDHTDGRRYMTWGEGFKDPLKLEKDLAAEGRQTVAIVDPHVKKDESYWVYKELSAGNFLVKSHDGTSPFVGDCWPGESVWGDFTSRETRSKWIELMSRYPGSSENLFIWNDMNEPSVFNGPEITLPKDTKHSGNWEHRDLHNLYGSYYHRATYYGRGGDSEKTFVLSRSYFAGSQRFGATWTGDNQATWKFLKSSIAQILSLNIAGFGFSGSDVGGFFGHPNNELFVRWHQLAAFSYPFYRSHAHDKSPHREPWLFGDQVLNSVRNAIKERYRLITYWYTTFAEYSKNGIPMIKPIWWDGSKEIITRIMEIPDIIEDHVFVGSSLLVRGITQSTDAIDNIDVFLPEGGWYEYFPRKMDALAYAGGYLPEGGIERKFHDTPGTIIKFPITIDTYPVFVRAGSILPLKLQSKQSTAFMINDPISLRVFVDRNQKAQGEVFFDDNSQTAWTFFSFQDNALYLEGKEGVFQGALIERIEIVGLSDAHLFKSAYLCLAGTSQILNVSIQDGALVIQTRAFPATFKGWRLHLVKQADMYQSCNSE